MDNLDQWIEKLNKDQKEAVLENSHPLLVLAGAGSGKTRVITTKIAYCVERLNINPWNILAVTFTNKAAKEMKDRVLEMLPQYEDRNFNIRTFHSFGVWLLRRYHQEANLAPSFTIYDDDDSLSLLKSIFPNTPKSELTLISKQISRAKDMGLTPRDNLDAISLDPFLKRAFLEYETALRNVGNVDFADLISIPTKLLKTNDEVLKFVRNRFQVVLVDEYQDSNVAQFELLHTLVGPYTKVCVVGDDDQSIYKFRGAEVKNILSFPQVFKNTKTITLNENYRSTKSILDVASSVIVNNSARHKKNLFTNNFQGDKPTVHYVSDENEEAKKVVNLIQRSGNYKSSAILYRTNAQSLPFETLLNKKAIPYKVIGALKFYDREEVKDAIALLQLFFNSRDIVGFRRMINKPPRGIGKSSVDKIESLLFETNGDVFDAINLACNRKMLSAKCSKEATLFVSYMEKAYDIISKGKLAEGVDGLLHDIGLVEYYKKVDKTKNTFKVDNLDRLVSSIDTYESSLKGLQQFLEEITLDRSKLGVDYNEDEVVVLITMHNTKGLEFDDVYVVGLEEDLFPSKRSIEEDSNVEEERRLFYVSATRAKSKLHFFSASSRRTWGKIDFNRTPSRFLNEIDEDLIKIQGNKPRQYSDDLDIFSDSALSFRRKQNPNNSGYKNSYNNYNDSSYSKGYKDTSNLIHQGFSPKAKKFKFEQENDTEISDSLYNVGDRVFNEEKGKGWIISSTKKKDREIISVKYDNGKEAKYISKFAKLEKIYDEL